MENAQIRYMTNGPESFTPDSRYFLGEVPEVGRVIATNFIERPQYFLVSFAVQHKS